LKTRTILLATLVLAAGALAAVTASAADSARVTAGKPSEFRFSLSKRSVVHGTVTFRVTNRGRVSHDFRIGGRKTKLLKRGQSATLRVTLRKGRAAFRCTVPGHAVAGMKGTLTVR